MKNIEFKFDTDEVVKKFNQLDSKNQKKSFRQALRKGGNILVKQTRTNLKTEVKNSTKATIKGRFKGLTLSKGIKLKVWKNGKIAKVNIMSDGRLKWFELGTVRRLTKGKGKKRKKARTTGSISPTHFFSNARNQTEGKVFSTIGQIISEEIIKVWNKNNAKI